jgi:hypothetical protein
MRVGTLADGLTGQVNNLRSYTTVLGDTTSSLIFLTLAPPSKSCSSGRRHAATDSSRPSKGLPAGRAIHGAIEQQPPPRPSIVFVSGYGDVGVYEKWAQGFRLRHNGRPARADRNVP